MRLRSDELTLKKGAKAPFAVWIHVTLIGLVLAGCQSAATEASQDDEMATENAQAIEPALKTRDFDEVTGLIEKLAVATLNEMETYGYASVHGGHYDQLSSEKSIKLDSGELLAAHSGRVVGLYHSVDGEWRGWDEGEGPEPLCQEPYRAIWRPVWEFEDLSDWDWSNLKPSLMAQLTNLVQDGASSDRWKDLFRSVDFSWGSQDLTGDPSEGGTVGVPVDYWLVSESELMWLSEEGGYLAVVSFDVDYTVRAYTQINGAQNEIKALGERWSQNRSSVDELLSLTDRSRGLNSPLITVVYYPSGEDITDLTQPHSVEKWSSLVESYPAPNSNFRVTRQYDEEEYFDEYFFGFEWFPDTEIATADATSLGALYHVKDASSERIEILAVDEVAPAYGPDGEALTCTPPR